ncbi:hypothetical protein E2C01_085093 [Portunus trituberculatus]|uniref:Uncharacterized protein n=1 Tax=Portunus trituberculatus TaxID=210409 RepID=A0A5B7J6I1_PORTR|nr:hypothetical protein [Portunus trituberculatus]
MDGCYIPNNPAYTDCWRPLSPTCGQAAILTPLKPLAAQSPPLHPPPAYPPPRSPLPPTTTATTDELLPARMPPDPNSEVLYHDSLQTHSSLVPTSFPPLFDLEPLPNFVTLSPHAPYNLVARMKTPFRRAGNEAAVAVVWLVLGYRRWHFYRYS